MPMPTYHEIPSRPGYLAGSDGSIIGKRGHALSQAMGANGYLAFRFSRPGHLPVTAASHVAICEAFHGLRPGLDMEVAHQNGIKTDNRPENLTWKTRSGNHADKLIHGTGNRGERHVGCKLSDRDVAEIRASGSTAVQLGRRFGVSAGYVQHIRAGRARKHVTPRA